MSKIFYFYSLLAMIGKRVRCSENIRLSVSVSKLVNVHTPSRTN